MSNFEPFFNYDEIDQVMAEDLKDVYTELRTAQDRLIASVEPKDIIEAAQDLLECQNEISVIARSINEEIFTVPAMIHVAGEVKIEPNPEDEEDLLYIQRCERCGSNLHFADSDLEPYFEIGEQVGKIINERFRRGPDEMLYRIGDRDLDKHELECVSLKNIFEES